MNKLIKKYSIATFFLAFIFFGTTIPFSNILSIVLPLGIMILIIMDRRKLLYKGDFLISEENRSIGKTLKLYFIWVCISFVMGILSARNYYEYKHLFQSLIGVSAPLALVLFYNPEIYKQVFKNWFKYGLILGICLFGTSLNFQSFYFAPILVLFLFFPCFKKKIVLGLLVFAILHFYACYLSDSREPLLKGAGTIMFGLCIAFHERIKPFHIRIIKYLSFGFTIFFFLYALPGFVNTMRGQSSGTYEESFGGGVDTRSLLYYDVVTSAINNNYVIQGRSLSRGNDIILSDILFTIADDDGFFDDTEFVGNERRENEICFTNIFTWMGLIGLILYWCFYFKAVGLATNHSRNVIIPIVGCYIAFRWSMGWIADMNGFNVSNLALWGLMAMCYSPYLRNMSNEEIYEWLKGFIPKF